MVILKFFPLFLLIGCSQISYLLEQSHGQLKIQWNSRPNQEVLNDKTVKESDKEKIRNIEVYKEYFYKFFKKKTTNIYAETFFLKDDAVTYLLTASHYKKIKPLHFGFPIVGSFPYIGFFNKESAEKKQKELEAEDYVTFIRPVYAYSTLGYFEDRILSSFFFYQDEELAELIFHELFHTIFFVKNEVDLNENLATYFSERLIVEYFQWGPEKQNQIKLKQQQNKRLVQEMNLWVKQLNRELKKLNPQSKKQAETLISQQYQQFFKPYIQKICDQEKIDQKYCFPVKGEWNHAKLAQFLTYEKEQDLIEKIHQKYQFTLNQLLKYFKKSYREFKKSKFKKFSKFLKHKEKL